jgi:hypothetical protein
MACFCEDTCLSRSQRIQHERWEKPGSVFAVSDCKSPSKPLQCLCHERRLARSRRDSGLSHFVGRFGAPYTSQCGEFWDNTQRQNLAKRPALNTHHSGAVIAPAMSQIQHWTDGKAGWDTCVVRNGRLDSHSALPIFAPQSTCSARLISASRLYTPTTMMMGLSGQHLFKFTCLQRIADMTGMEEALLILACAVLSLGRGYFCVRWPGLAPLSALRARVLGWVMLALGSRQAGIIRQGRGEGTANRASQGNYAPGFAVSGATAGPVHCPPL